ncbi:MAG: peroxiredoxin [Candidatus Riflebacteria bacterium]|nr:peroxiredoxin [Candidatus Riflebacteria bacterium]
MTTIKIGDQAPDFALPAHDGTTFTSASLRDRQPLVLFFYPADETPICTKEACAFRDAYAEFVAAGAAVVGISSDYLNSHKKFAAGHQISYPLLSDADGLVRALFGVPKTFGLFPGRVTYIIDREGIVRHIYDSQLFPERHVAEALTVVKRLSQPSAK